MNELRENRALEAEVDALLHYLASHDSTPKSFGKKLLQRFASSSPSATYLADVAEAFTAGSFDGTSYSGSQGDLAATVAAVILHPEAKGVEGVLREPMLKIVHVLRSMEYKDSANEPIVFENLEETIGQFPYGQPVAAGHLDARHLVGYLDVITAVIRSGVSHKCNSETAVGASVEYWEDWRTRNEVCPQGEMTFLGSGNSTQILHQLDDLLTGGRLGVAVEASVGDVYALSRGPVDNVKDAQQAIVMSAEFNTLGVVDSSEHVGGTALSKKFKRLSTDLRAYKAAILLFMDGGADTFNMVVPLDDTLYAEYSHIRQDLAKGTSELLAITTAGQTGTSFGVHSSLDFLKSLYDLGQAAFVANIGSLVAPTSVASFSDGTVQTCVGLFSHAAQARGVQSLECQISGSDTTGAGGRLADALATGSSAFSTATFSMSGMEVWSQGHDTVPVFVDSNHVRLDFFEHWRRHIQELTAQTYSNSVAEAWSQRLLQSVQNSEIIEDLLADVTTSTDYNTDDSLRQQLYDVSRLISARVSRSAERDLFFVRIGGFDLHDNANEGLASLFDEIDTALEGFVAEMEAQDMWRNVVLLSSSEFGRTLTSSDDGSDHGWAGNHFIVGGGVQGGQIFNQYPSSLVGNALDLGRGRLIPEYPWESVMAPVAEWMGLETSQLQGVFPNIENFSDDHVILYDSLFSQ